MKLKWIKGKNGKFAGSIGDGKNQIPTAAPAAASPWDVAAQAFDTPSCGTVAAAWDAYQTVRTDAEGLWNDALNEFEKNDGLTGWSVAKDFKKEQALRVAAEKYAATDDGQVVVLNRAIFYADAGNTRLANMLGDAALTGQKAREAEAARIPHLWTMSALDRQDGDKSSFDRVDDAYAKYFQAVTTPFVVPPSGSTPGKTIPFNGSHAAEHVQKVANGVLSATYERASDRRGYGIPLKAEVYSPELIEEARRYQAISIVLGERGQEQYPNQDVNRFMMKVVEAHRANGALVKARLAERLRRAESVVYHNGDAYRGHNTDNLFY